MSQFMVFPTYTFTLEEALTATKIDFRCNPEAALALWLYASKKIRVGDTYLCMMVLALREI